MVVRLVIPTQPWHLVKIDLQDGQSQHTETLRDHPEYGEWLVRHSIVAYSVVVDGVFVAALGVTPDEIDKRKGTSWALFAKDAGKHLRYVLKKSVEVLDSLDMRRIETTATHRLPQAKRWLEMLGFEYEGTMRSFDDMGYDYDMYARVRT